MWHMLPVIVPYIKKETSSTVLNTGVGSAVNPLSKYNLSMAIKLMLRDAILNNKLKFREVPFGSHLGNGYAVMEILSKLSLIPPPPPPAHDCSKNKNCRLKANLMRGCENTDTHGQTMLLLAY